METPWDGGGTDGRAVGAEPLKGIAYGYVMAATALMPATACPSSTIAAVIWSGVKTREVDAGSAVIKGADDPESASVPDAGAPET